MMDEKASRNYATKHPALSPRERVARLFFGAPGEGRIRLRSIPALTALCATSPGGRGLLLPEHVRFIWHPVVAAGQWLLVYAPAVEQRGRHLRRMSSACGLVCL